MQSRGPCNLSIGGLIGPCILVCRKILYTELMNIIEHAEYNAKIWSVKYLHFSELYTDLKSSDDSEDTDSEEPGPVNEVKVSSPPTSEEANLTFTKKRQKWR